MSIETLGNLFQILMPAHMYRRQWLLLVKISGDDQEGLINTELTNPFIVEVHDQNTADFDGVVTFTLLSVAEALPQ